MTTDATAVAVEAAQVTTAVRRRAGRRVPWRMIGSVGAGTALIAWHATAYGNWLIDDAGITFDYARSIATGLGPVVQAGSPPVEGYSNPAWLILLVVGRLLGLFDHGAIFGVPDYVLYPKALALLCCAGIVGAFYSAAAALTRRAWLVTLAASATLAVIPSFVIWCFSGLENSLYALVIVLLGVVLFRAVLGGTLLTPPIAITAGLLATIAALTRPDGIIYAAAYPLVAILLVTRPTLNRTVRMTITAGLVFLVPFGLFILFRYLEFGRLVPNTAVAKAQSTPTFDYLNRAQQLVAYAGWAAVLMAAACVGVAITRRSRLRTGIIALLVPLGLAVIAFCLLNPDWMAQYRFATPIWPLAALVTTLAVGQVLTSVRFKVQALLSLALATAVALSTVQFVNDIREFRATATVPLCWVAERFGRVINGYTDFVRPGNLSLLAPDLGGTALTSSFRIIDLAGLGDRRVAEFYGAGDMAGLRDYIFNDVKPTVIHFHDVWGTMTGLVSEPRLTRDYYPIIDGDFVRKDAIAGPTQLAGLRAYAATEVPIVLNRNPHALRRSCGPTLHVGQTPQHT